MNCHSALVNLGESSEYRADSKTKRGGRETDLYYLALVVIFDHALEIPIPDFQMSRVIF